MKNPLFAFFLLLFFAIHTPASAEVKTFATAGGWDAFGGTANDGQLVCGVSTSGNDKYIAVKYYYGESHFTIQLANGSWTSKNGAQIDVTMQFDDESAWSGRGRTGHLNTGMVVLTIDVPSSKIDRWLDEFKMAYKLYVRFPNSKVSDWTVDLDGTNDIAGSFMDCLRVLARR